MMDPMASVAQRRLQILRNVDGWLVLTIGSLCLMGLLFIGSATSDDALFAAQQGRQSLFVVVGLGVGFFVLLPHYVHILRGSWFFYGVAVLALLGLPLFRLHFRRAEAPRSSGT